MKNKTAIKGIKGRLENTEKVNAESLHPHEHGLKPLTPDFLHEGQIRGKKGSKNAFMKPYTIPVLRKFDPKKWYVEYHYQVPQELMYLYNKPRKRFRNYGQQLNTLQGEAREKYAVEFRDEVEFWLKYLNRNPFEEELNKHYGLTVEKSNLSEEDKRKLTPANIAFKLFIKSRDLRKVDDKTITTYQNTVNWLSAHLSVIGMLDKPISLIRHIQISDALDKISESEKWAATTINKQVGFAMMIFDWLAVQDYILKNPSKGKFVSLRTDKKIHKWYDRKTAEAVKKAIKNSDTPVLLRICQFTYWILIRSKEELRNIKIGDIDTDLKRIAFRKEWTKNDSDQFRDYPLEFEQVLNEMDISQYPDDYYIFGSGGLPGKKQAGANSFSLMWKPIRENLKLPDEYTIYGWKHTRVIHEMMKGTSGYEISHMARHAASKTTDDYKRDYDFTLVNVYKKEDLTF